MRLGYIDTSYFLAIALNESGSSRWLKEFHSFDRVVTAGLLESEVLATLKREKIEMKSVEHLFDTLKWIFPDQRLASQLHRVFRKSYLRGADAYHLASALWALEDYLPETWFLTLDEAQRKVADQLGFQVS